MEPILIREMRKEDCGRVSRLQCESFRFGAEREGLSEAQIADYARLRASEEAIRNQLQEYDCLVACCAAGIVGVIGIKENEITKLYVDPAKLRLGIGSTLFTAASRLVAQALHGEIWLGTIFKGTLRFYEPLGMSEFDRKTIDSGPMAGVESLLLKKTLDCSGRAQPRSAATDGPPGVDGGRTSAPRSQEKGR